MEYTVTYTLEVTEIYKDNPEINETALANIDLEILAEEAWKPLNCLRRKTLGFAA